MTCTYTVITQEYDGDGQRIGQLENGQADWLYYVRSSVLGGAVVAELNQAGGVWLKDVFVYAAGEMIAQQKQNSNAADEVRWNYRNPVTGAQRGAINTEPDPFGVDAGLTEPQPDAPIIAESGVMNPGRYSDAFDGRMGCTLDGAPASCDQAYSLLGSGAAAQCPNNDCGPQVFRVNGQNVLSSPFRAYADGRSGYQVPVWSSVNVLNDDGTVYSAGKPGIIDWVFRKVETPLIDCSDQILKRVNVNDAGNDKAITNNNFFYLHRDVVDDFRAALAEVAERFAQEFAKITNAFSPAGQKRFLQLQSMQSEFGFNELFRTTEQQQKLFDAYVARGRTPPAAANPKKYGFHQLGAAFDIDTATQLWRLAGKTIRQIFETHNFTWFGAGDTPHFTHNDFLRNLSGDANLNKRKTIAEQAEAYFKNCL